jgi:hypothetical protein
MLVGMVSGPRPPAVAESIPALVAGDSMRPRRTPRRGRAGVVGVGGAAAVVLVVTDPLSGGGGSSGGVSNNGYPTSTQMVVRESISQQTQVSATLGYAGDLKIRLPAGNAPAMVTAARQAVTTDQGVLAVAQSALQGDSAALSQVRAMLAADQQQESVDCAGNNAAQTPSSGAGATGSGASVGCASEAQSVASGQQSVTADAAKVFIDQTTVNSAGHSLAAAQAALATADAQATVYGQDSTFTSVPAAGAIVRRGQRLFSIDGAPVMLLYGSAVATRAFTAGMSPGADVAELNANLDALGYATGVRGDAFTAAGAVAIGRLQAAYGEPRTGALLLGAVVFELGPVRVTSVMPTVAVGSSVMAGPVLSASWITRQVSIQLDAGFEGQVKVGDPVTITLPDNQTTPGRISYVSPVASTGQNGSTIQVDAVPTDPAATGGLDQAPVNVSITTASASDVLVVPVDALLALASGGYTVEKIGAAGKHSLVPVSTGLFDDADGLVAVSGSGLAVGQRVVVPGG